VTFVPGIEVVSVHGQLVMVKVVGDDTVYVWFPWANVVAAGQYVVKVLTISVVVNQTETGGGTTVALPEGADVGAETGGET